VEAVGLFKAESKSLFVDIDPSADGIQLALKEGVELSKIDKGCLILNLEADKGYELMIFDANGKGEEAQYWKDKFLGVLIRQNEFLHTQGFLTITKNFVTQQLPGEFEVSKTEQIDILNRSMDYFKTHGNFNKDEFETEVLHHEDLIQSFRKYDEQYRMNNDWEPANEFEISPQAVKKQARVFKSVIKLDKNFHIYVHGARELVEKGYDEGVGKHYYKIYFDQET
ncbi:MAG: nucleoid-associated protein, partial [Bacteroidota bacterium]